MRSTISRLILASVASSALAAPPTARVLVRRVHTEWNYDRCDESHGPANWPQSTAGERLVLQSPIDLCGAQDLDLLPAVPGRSECLSFVAGTSVLPSQNPSKAINVRLRHDGLLFKVDFLDGHPGSQLLLGEELKLQACALPVRIGRQPGHHEDIEWRLAEGAFHVGRVDGEGSEHFIEGRQLSMEVQLLYYNAVKFADLAAAKASGASGESPASASIRSVR